MRISSPWLDGPVPAGYWDLRAHRRDYLCWLGQQLGYQSWEDWYQVSTDDVKRNRGGGLMAMYWRSSIIVGLQDCFPEYAWKEWLFNACPRSFWRDRRNHRRYLDWLAEQIGIVRPEDWYDIANEDFGRHGGGALLGYYDWTISTAVISNFPECDWKEWMFRKTPKGFWEVRRNRRRYLKWLGQELGFRRANEWYRVTREDIYQHYGNTPLKMFAGSPYRLLKDAFPRYDWQEWMFARVPDEFWNSPANRRRYMDWLGKQLGCSQPEDWYQVRRVDFVNHFAAGYLASGVSHFDLLREYVPDLDWSGSRADRISRANAGGRGSDEVPSETRPRRSPAARGAVGEPAISRVARHASRNPTGADNHSDRTYAADGVRSDPSRKRSSMGQSHDELRLRRRKMARAVAGGLTVSQAAERFEVSDGTIRRACAENNIPPRRAGRRTGESLTLQILAALINTRKSQETIASELETTQQKVEQVASEARRVGIRLHPKRPLPRDESFGERS